MNDFSMDDLRSVLGDVPPEPVAPDRAAAIRRRVRHVRQRRSVVGAVALALPAASLGMLRGDGDGSEPLFPVDATATATSPVRPPAPTVRPGPDLAVTLNASATNVQVGEEVAFTVTWTDSDGHFLGYHMSFGDIGASKYDKVLCASRAVHPESGREELTHAWSEPGTYHVYYTVRTGDCGATAEKVTSALDIVVRPAPPAPPTNEPSTAPSSNAQAS